MHVCVCALECMCARVCVCMCVLVCVAKTHQNRLYTEGEDGEEARSLVVPMHMGTYYHIHIH